MLNSTQTRPFQASLAAFLICYFLWKATNIYADVLEIPASLRKSQIHHRLLIFTQIGDDIDGEAAEDQSGRSVAISDDGLTIAVGAYRNDRNGTNAGHARVYMWNGSSWVQKGSDFDGEAEGDWFGYSVALDGSGDVVAIGAIYNDGVHGIDSGHVQVWQWSGSAWEQKGGDLDGEAAEDYSGSTTALSSDGDVIVIGAEFNDGTDNTNTIRGHARVYGWSGSAWVQRGFDLDGEFQLDYFGIAVSISADGGVVAVGGYQNDGNGDSSGHVRVFAYDGASYQQKGADIDGEAEGDRSGRALTVSASGDTVVIGAYRNGDAGEQSGHTRVYEWSGSAWVQRGADIDGAASNDQSGWSVSLSADEVLLAIGNNGNAGGVRIFEWLDGAWSQKGATINGETASDDFGSALALSKDGGTLVVGANRNDDNGNNSGHVRVFSVPPPTSAPTNAPTAMPTKAPSDSPTATPTTAPSDAPTATPTTAPSDAPTAMPTTAPSDSPTVMPTTVPSDSPSATPTTAPSGSPTVMPTTAPSDSPTATPTTAPSDAPTATPTTAPIITIDGILGFLNFVNPFFYIGRMFGFLDFFNPFF